MAEYRSTGRELRKSPKGLIAGIFLIALAAGGAYFGKIVLNNMESLEPVFSEESEISVPEMEEESSKDHPSGIDFGMVAIPIEKIHRGPLVLVNNDFPIEDTEEGIVSVFEQKSDYLTVRDMEVYLLDEPMLALNQLVNAFFEQTGHADLLIREGYVTRETQKRLYEADLQINGADGTVPMPGSSEYESGYAFELSLFTNGMFTDFTPEGDYDWIVQHAAEYGFVQRYPEDKTAITHVSDQPYIYRYVGTPHAWYMYKNHLCLEEYQDLLESYPADGKLLQYTDQLGRGYGIYYVSIDPETTEETVSVPLPIGYQYSLSGNNKHGFYVTVVMDENSTVPDSGDTENTGLDTEADTE